MSDELTALTFITALGCALNAGVFFAFSSFVMKALARLPTAHGIAAMQSINVGAVTPAFMTALFGTAVGCVGLVVWALTEWHVGFGPYLLAGTGLYLVGTVGLTVAYHVPRNNHLATVAPQGEQAGRHWTRYLAQWTAWNHVRGAAAVAAAALLTLALVAA